MLTILTFIYKKVWTLIMNTAVEIIVANFM
ncbi:hypothetical protein X742_11835 [Mesorhizobium sp. LNHC232B00]|nr:hypothetical protein X742_11835 [Mesorhizobium sp. LNHC232B00]